MNKRLASIIKIFKKLYPDPQSELVFKNEYQLIVSVILSAQCTDKKVNEVTPLLFKKSRNFEELAQTRVPFVEQIIRPINYFKTKSRALVTMAKEVESRFKGKLPRTFEELTTLPGVGRKTANVLLLELGIQKALPVDTHVFRVSKRLALSNGNKPEQIEEDLKASFPSSKWRDLHHWLIFHGRRVCKAQRPLCNECALSAFCPSKRL